MGEFRWATMLAGLCLGIAPAAWAQTLSVSADPAPLAVSTAVAGAEPDPDSDATTTYDVTTAGATARIVARLDSPLPSGVTLTVEAEAPPGAASAGPVPLTTADQDVVTGIPPSTNASGLQITYTLSATAAAGVISLRAPTVTFTLVSP